MKTIYLNNESEAYLWLRHDAAARLVDEIEKAGKAVRRLRTRRFIFVIDKRVPPMF